MANQKNGIKVDCKDCDMSKIVKNIIVLNIKKRLTHNINMDN